MSAWWSEATGTLVGAYGGAGVGMLCGLYGAVAGILAPQGRARRAVLGVHAALLAVGVLALLGGLVAALQGQPRHVTYPLLLLGFVPTAVLGGLWPVMRRRYAEAEGRRLEAEALRRGRD